MMATKIIIGPELLKLMSEWEIVDKLKKKKKTEYNKIRYDLSRCWERLKAGGGGDDRG